MTESWPDTQPDRGPVVAGGIPLEEGNDDDDDDDDDGGDDDDVGEEALIAFEKVFSLPRPS